MENFMSGILGKLQGDEGRARLYGMGLGLSQLGAGQPVNIAPALDMLQSRQTQNQLSEQMQNGGFMDMFSPQEQAYLATLPPQVAQEFIGQRVFAQPEPVQYDVLGSGLVIDPSTGAVVADHRQEPVSSAPVVNVNTGAESNVWGEAPNNMVWLRDSTGQIVTRPDPSGQGVQPVAVPILGGPEDTSDADTLRNEGAATSSVNVLGTVSDLRAAIDENPNTTTGFFGSILSGIPGTDAYDATALTNTIRSNLAFDQLQAMREASPTGGALGAVSAPELVLLESNLANLDLNQSREQVMRQLSVIERDYTRILQQAYRTSDDPAALDAIFGGRPSFVTDSGTVTSDMSDEELLQLYLGGQ